MAGSSINLITILGLGNILLGDEGFGVHFVNWLSRRYRFPASVRIVDGGTLGRGLLDIICSCSHLIVIDALKTDDAPGSLYRFAPDQLPACRPGSTSAHEVCFADVLSAAELLDQCPAVVFLCIVPEKYHAMDLQISRAVRDRFADMEGLLLKELRQHAIQPELIADTG